jgi:hypothetical protein
MRSAASLLVAAVVGAAYAVGGALPAAAAAETAVDAALSDAARLVQRDWRVELKSAFDKMPQMKEDRTVDGPLHGRIIAGTVTLPATLKVDGDLTILARHIAFTGQRATIMGAGHDVTLLPIETMNTSSRATGGAAVQSLITVDESGIDGFPGSPGFNGAPGPTGNSGRSATNYDGSNPCVVDIPGDGQNGGNGSGGQQGTGGGGGGTGGSITVSVPSGSTNSYLLRSKGGRGGQGGQGGPGGSGGGGGNGGAGGSVFCSYGPGGPGGYGGDGGNGGGGGAGAGGQSGGDAGSITVTYPAGYDPALISTDASGGTGGDGGLAGLPGQPGLAGFGGFGGVNTVNGESGPDGGPGRAGQPGSPGTAGSPGGAGKPGTVTLNGVGGPPPPPPPPPQTVSMVAMHSSKCLDVPGASLSDGVQLQQFGCHGGTNQQWRIEPVGADTYQVKSVSSGKCLDVWGASIDDLAAVTQFTCHGGTNQLWRLDASPLPGQTVTLSSARSGKCLDVAASSWADSARTYQYFCHSGGNQRWLLITPGSATPPPPSPQCGYTWDTNKVFEPDEHYTGCNGTLYMQLDGNLVIYGLSGRPLWSSGTAGLPNASGGFSFIGDLYVIPFEAHFLAWTSGSYATGGHLAFQGDVNLVIYNAAGAAVWATNTFGG